MAAVVFLLGFGSYTVPSMGTDGPGLFSDDTAADVRDAYREALEDGAGDVEAEAVVLRDFADALADPDDAVIVWLALAYTQSKLGRLSAPVRQRALATLAAGGDLPRWQEAGARAVRQRAAVLQKVRAQLVAPQPAPKKVRRPPRPVSTLAIGQVLGYRARSGRLHLMRVAGMVDTRYYVAPVIRYLVHAEPSTSIPDELADIPDRVFHPSRWPVTEIMVIGANSRDRPENHGIVVVGSTPPLGEAAAEPNSSTTWPDIASYLDHRDRDMDSPDY
jgi:hypothetical protein